jgi:hypothetical protein
VTPRCNTNAVVPPSNKTTIAEPTRILRRTDPRDDRQIAWSEVYAPPIRLAILTTRATDRW